MNKSRIGEKFDCIVKAVGDKWQSDFDWLNGAAVGWFAEPGKCYRLVGEIKTTDGYMITELYQVDGPDQEPSR